MNSSSSSPPPAAKSRGSRAARHKKPDECRNESDRVRTYSKRVLNHPRREEARRFKNGKAYSKKTLQEVFNRAFADYSRKQYREQHPLSKTDIIKTNAAIRHEMYDAKGLESGWLTFRELQKRFPTFLRHLRKEIEKKYEVLQKCVAQWGVDWAIQRVLQRDKIYQPKGIRKVRVNTRNRKKDCVAGTEEVANGEWAAGEEDVPDEEGVADEEVSDEEEVAAYFGTDEESQVRETSGNRQTNGMRSRSENPEKLRGARYKEPVVNRNPVAKNTESFNNQINQDQESSDDEIQPNKDKLQKARTCIPRESGKKKFQKGIKKRKPVTHGTRSAPKETPDRSSKQKIQPCLYTSRQ